jgi:hypothetical protein
MPDCAYVARCLRRSGRQGPSDGVAINRSDGVAINRFVLLSAAMTARKLIGSAKKRPFLA